MKRDASRLRSGRRSALETILVLGLSLKLIATVVLLLVLPVGRGPLLDIPPAHAQEPSAEVSPVPPPASMTPADLAMNAKYEQMIQALKTREDALALREERLNEREKALNILEQDINDRLAQLQAKHEELAALVRRQEELVQEQKQIKDARIEHLVAAYKGMRPEKAGSLVNSLDDDVAVRLLAAMPGRNAGQILAFVNPEKAARLTKAISDMRQSQGLPMPAEDAASAAQ